VGASGKPTTIGATLGGRAPVLPRSDPEAFGSG